MNTNFFFQVWKINKNFFFPVWKINKNFFFPVWKINKKNSFQFEEWITISSFKFEEVKDYFFFPAWRSERLFLLSSWKNPRKIMSILHAGRYYIVYYNTAALCVHNKKTAFWVRFCLQFNGFLKISGFPTNFPSNTRCENLH